MESITVDLIPLLNCNNQLPTCHASQNDSGRHVEVKMTENGEPYYLKGDEDITLAVKVSDNTEVCKRVMNSGSDSLIIVISSDMTHSYGDQLCELVIKDSTSRVASSNFIMHVEKLP